MMNNGKSIICLLIGLLVGLALGWFILRESPTNTSGEVTTEVFIDTIPYVDLVPVDSTLARADIVTLPIVRPPAQKSDNPITKPIPVEVQAVDTLTLAICTENHPDSATVAVPITQYEFEDSTYNLKVSGFHVSVDELTIYPRREVVTIKQPPNRWHIGISAGYGFTPKGAQPYIGLSLTYSIISF